MKSANKPLRIISRKSLRMPKICLIIALFLLSIMLVNGLGVSPAKKTIDFQPNFDVEMEFNIINSEEHTFDASLSAMGEIADIIFFENDIIKVDSSNYRVPFRVIMRFPSKMEPGIHKGIIGINPILSELSGNVFAAFIAPQIPISVRVPYPSKYADISIVVFEVDEGTPVPIFIEFDNMGSEDILEAGALLELYKPDGTLIDTLSAAEISINENTLGKTQAQPSPVLKRGYYRIVAKSYYDGLTKTVESNFSVGEPIVRIRDLATKELSVDEVNKVIFKVYNDWNTELFVKGYLEIGDRQNQMPDFKLKEQKEEEVTGFLDTTGLLLGEYNMSVVLTYANKVKTKVFLVTIIEKVKVEKEPFDKILLLIIILIIVIILIIGILIFRISKRKLKRKQKQK